MYDQPGNRHLRTSLGENRTVGRPIGLMQDARNISPDSETVIADSVLEVQ